MDNFNGFTQIIMNRRIAISSSDIQQIFKVLKRRFFLQLTSGCLALNFTTEVFQDLKEALLNVYCVFKEKLNFYNRNILILSVINNLS